MTGRIAYIMSRFPHLPETFILREMEEVERHGWQVALYPLMLQQQPVVHAAAQRWIPRARRLPFASPAVLGANLRGMAAMPGRYSATWGRALWDNRGSANFLVRAIALLPKAVYAARLMQREGIDHIHAHYATHPALAAWAIHRLTGISYSITVHAHDIFVRTAMLATKLREAAFVVAISDYNREHLARTVGPWIRHKTHVVHCGIMPEHYRASAQAATPGRRFELISIGSLQPYKGQRYLIEACALLRERGIPLRCRIIGGGEQQAALERRIAELGLQEIVELCGPLPQEEVARMLPQAHCYVQPSIITRSGKMEGIPVSLMEALACRLPTVATAISGIPELIRDAETGYLVPPAYAPALAEAVGAIESNPAEAMRRAGDGRDLVLREFELGANVSRLERLFAATLSGRAEPALNHGLYTIKNT